ncbi:hypothetical protein GOB43_29775 [Sinorhizobium meliloti]|uniref:hypothetical protein n=1 Tax=Rhizobium meliloti TaxID=382 RepID=UPI000B49731C|nr:hypothetical protein [Sinorhizobium meliloti]ASP51728.1 hypothetical protein CDO31_09255 [Sinorhizobium meliloti]MDW9409261.1 hypothetical protein [Sinorhizobium meliloti]MDW9442190.1 hypothetical protein [Sinorhizobium meliloti]MDW9454417.1 hypothetical protein [Sinorhizobium meliloti]MDW9468278.1 hypothetical protein [Sinorhizobium meliloti]
MNERDQSHMVGWVISFALAGAFFIWILSHGQFYELACGDADEHCFREWVSALSGWAAATAAALTIGILVKQVNAQQLQTDFMLGDASPSIDAVQHLGRNKRVIVRIRNWNRRSMILRKIRLIDAPAPFGAVKLSFDDNSPYSSYDALTRIGSVTFERPPLIEGWVSRDEKPPMLKFGILALLANSGEFLSDEWRQIKIEVQYELVGNPVPITALVPIHMTSAPIDDPNNIHDEDMVGLGADS